MEIYELNGHPHFGETADQKYEKTRNVKENLAAVHTSTNL